MPVCFALGRRRSLITRSRPSDDEKPITLTGKVTKVSPDNPHGWLYLDVKNEKGRVINWALELPPPNVLRRNGFDTSVYKAMEEAHEEITVKAFQAKDGAKHAWAAGLTRSDGKTVITLGGLPSQPYSAKPNGDRRVKQQLPADDSGNPR